MASPRPQYNQGYLPNGANAGPVPGAAALLPNQGRVLQQGPVRVLCVADVRGNLRSLNTLANQARADYIIHTGDFGFYDETSLERIAEKTLKHVAQYSPLIGEGIKRVIGDAPPNTGLKARLNPKDVPLSELPQLLNKEFKLDIPVYTVWGACEDVRVLEKFRSAEYRVDNLHIIDEANSRLLDIGGVKLRLLGLGGAVVMHKLFDNGEGKTTIAGGQGTMWTTLLQMGELVDTAHRVYDPTETRVFVTHASPAREGMLNQLSVTLKADFSISAGLHFRYGSSYNEFSVNPTLDHYRGKLAASKASFTDVWETVRGEVESALNTNDGQKKLLDNALDIVTKMPSVANGGNPFGGPVAGNEAGGQVDESAFKNMWNFNLADAAYGYLVLEVEGGRIGTEMRAQGFNFAHRSGKPAQAGPQAAAQQVPTAPSPAAPAQHPTPPVTQLPPTGASPAPQAGRPQTQAAPKSGPPPAAAPVTQGKPLTPQPSSTNVNSSSGPAEKAVPATNGAAEKAFDTPSKAAASPAFDRSKPSPALFVSSVASEEACRDLFSEDEKAKIKNITTKKGPKFTSYVVDFGSLEESKAVYERQSELRKGGRGGPSVKYFNPDFKSGGAGTWQGSNRGGATNATGRGGFQSGSESEGAGRGRGGFRGRGRGRGDDRGGRGGRGGRGSFQGKSEGSGDTPKPAEKATAGDS